MIIELYLDVFFGFNLLMNIILLYAVKILRKKKTKLRRMIAGAATGAFIACIQAIFPEIPRLLQLLVGFFLMGILMLFIAFPTENKTIVIRDFLVLSALSLLLGGGIDMVRSFLGKEGSHAMFFGNIVYGNISAVTLLLLSSILLPLFFIIYVKVVEKKEEETLLCEVFMRIGNEEFSCKGFVDTGNFLREPVSGSPVVIAESTTFGKTFHELCCQEPQRFCAVPFHSVGKANGLLEGIRLDEIVIFQNGEQFHSKKAVAAVSIEGFGTDALYQVILHRALLPGGRS